ncbi:hypothetical protein RN001_014238 [Aquatica leii]|uniref:Uncharacterized protein n=1 Tax=Aquatica leii TaxID=1421715 RepID=A0AAN7QDS1_9COLE|nr:hypothetical protein RN001_014238 [Aquatica leii]
MVKRVRNKFCLPNLDGEGVITKPIPPNIQRKSLPWYTGMCPFERVFAHHTLASLRRHAHFKPFSGQVPKDSLDIILVSPYNKSVDLFPDKVDPCMQPETYGIDTWRRLRNTKDLPPDRIPKSPEFSFYEIVEGGRQMERYNISHPVLIGGIKERVHPNYVKLMNSSHHSPQTNAGYCRQDSDGSYFKY